MTARLNRWAADPAAMVVLPALLSALLVGVLLSRNVEFGVAALIGLCYAPLVLVNLRVGLIVWVPLTFLEGLSVFNAAGKAAGLLIALGWIGLGRTLGERVSLVVERHRVTAAGLAGLLVWVTLSLAWAVVPSAAAKDLWHWYAVALIFLVVATVARDVPTLRLLAHAFILGGVLSIVAGVAFGGLASPSVNLEAADSGRLYGALGDPNMLAAGLVSAAVLAAGLLPGTRSGLARAWLLIATGVMVVGIVASQSRGGFLAAGATLLVALVVFRERRAHVLVLVLFMVGIGGAWLATSPGAVHRLTHFDDGSGRTDIWRVASRVFEDHPVAGAGLANFPEVSGDYVRRPGSLTNLAVIVDHPHVVHNLYLEALTNIGVVGLALFLIFLGGCLHAAWEAGRRLDRLGDPEAATFARAVLVASIAFLVASIFISTGVDKRLWMLLALGPALKGMALDRLRDPG